MESKTGDGDATTGATTSVARKTRMGSSMYREAPHLHPRMKAMVVFESTDVFRQSTSSLTDRITGSKPVTKLDGSRADLLRLFDVVGVAPTDQERVGSIKSIRHVAIGAPDLAAAIASATPAARKKRRRTESEMEDMAAVITPTLVFYCNTPVASSPGGGFIRRGQLPPEQLKPGRLSWTFGMLLLLSTVNPAMRRLLIFQAVEKLQNSPDADENASGLAVLARTLGSLIKDFYDRVEGSKDTSVPRRAKSRASLPLLWTCCSERHFPAVMEHVLGMTDKPTAGFHADPFPNIADPAQCTASILATLGVMDILVASGVIPHLPDARPRVDGKATTTATVVDALDCVVTSSTAIPVVAGMNIGSGASGFMAGCTFTSETGSPMCTLSEAAFALASILETPNTNGSKGRSSAGREGLPTVPDIIFNELLSPFAPTGGPTFNFVIPELRANMWGVVPSDASRRGGVYAKKTAAAMSSWIDKVSLGYQNAGNRHFTVPIANVYPGLGSRLKHDGVAEQGAGAGAGAGAGTMTSPMLLKTPGLPSCIPVQYFGESTGKDTTAALVSTRTRMKQMAESLSRMNLAMPARQLMSALFLSPTTLTTVIEEPIRDPPVARVKDRHRTVQDVDVSASDIKAQGVMGFVSILRLALIPPGGKAPAGVSAWIPTRHTALAAFDAPVVEASTTYNTLMAFIKTANLRLGRTWRVLVETPLGKLSDPNRALAAFVISLLTGVPPIEMLVGTGPDVDIGLPFSLVSAERMLANLEVALNVKTATAARLAAAVDTGEDEDEVEDMGASWTPVSVGGGMATATLTTPTAAGAVARTKKRGRTGSNAPIPMGKTYGPTLDTGGIDPAAITTVLNTAAGPASASLSGPFGARTWLQKFRIHTTGSTDLVRRIMSVDAIQMKAFSGDKMVSFVSENLHRSNLNQGVVPAGTVRQSFSKPVMSDVRQKLVDHAAAALMFIICADFTFDGLGGIHQFTFPPFQPITVAELMDPALKLWIGQPAPGMKSDGTLGAIRQVVSDGLMVNTCDEGDGRIAETLAKLIPGTRMPTLTKLTQAKTALAFVDDTVAAAAAKTAAAAAAAASAASAADGKEDEDEDEMDEKVAAAAAVVSEKVMSEIDTTVRAAQEGSKPAWRFVEVPGQDGAVSVVKDTNAIRIRVNRFKILALMFGLRGVPNLGVMSPGGTHRVGANTPSQVAALLGTRGRRCPTSGLRGGNTCANPFHTCRTHVDDTSLALPKDEQWKVGVGHAVRNMVLVCLATGSPPHEQPPEIRMSQTVSADVFDTVVRDVLGMLPALHMLLSTEVLKKIKEITGEASITPKTLLAHHKWYVIRATRLMYATRNAHRRKPQGAPLAPEDVDGAKEEKKRGRGRPSLSAPSTNVHPASNFDDPKALHHIGNPSVGLKKEEVPPVGHPSVARSALNNHQWESVEPIKVLDEDMAIVVQAYTTMMTGLMSLSDTVLETVMAKLVGVSKSVFFPPASASGVKTAQTNVRFSLAEETPSSLKRRRKTETPPPLGVRRVEETNGKPKSKSKKKRKKNKSGESSPTDVGDDVLKALASTRKCGGSSGLTKTKGDDDDDDDDEFGGPVVSNGTGLKKLADPTEEMIHQLEAATAAAMKRV